MVLRAEEIQKHTTIDERSQYEQITFVSIEPAQLSEHQMCHQRQYIDVKEQVSASLAIRLQEVEQCQDPGPDNTYGDCDLRWYPDVWIVDRLKHADCKTRQTASHDYCAGRSRSSVNCIYALKIAIQRQQKAGPHGCDNGLNVVEKLIQWTQRADESDLSLYQYGVWKK